MLMRLRRCALVVSLAVLAMAACASPAARTVLPSAPAAALTQSPSTPVPAPTASPSPTPVRVPGQLAWVTLARGSEDQNAVHVTGVRVRNLQNGEERSVLSGDWPGSAALEWDSSGSRLLVNISKFSTKTVGRGYVRTSLGSEAKVVEVPSGHLTDLVLPQDVTGFDGKWLQDGDLVALLSSTPTGAPYLGGPPSGNALVVLQSTGAVIRTLFRIQDVAGEHDPQRITAFDISADGRNVVFAVSGGGRPQQVLTVASAGGAPRPVTEFPPSQLGEYVYQLSDVAWSPDPDAVGFVYRTKPTLGSSLCIAYVRTGERSCRSAAEWAPAPGTSYLWLAPMRVVVVTGVWSGPITISSFDLASGKLSTLLTGSDLILRGISPDRDYLLVQRPDTATSTTTIYPFDLSTKELGAESIWRSASGLSGDVAWGR